MNILLSGSHGLIGTALVPALTAQDHRTARLIRATSTFTPGAVVWDPVTGQVADPRRLDGLDAVVHLAGESIAAGRWTSAKKARIRDSRVRGTRLLAETLARLPRPPRALVCASAVGYYGDRGDEILREESAPGTGFLADVCREWEAAADPARRSGIRVVHLRTGIVLSSVGGALAQLLPVFRLGLGGRLGSGRQYMSWISIDDVVGAILHVLANERVAGPVNLVAPHPVANRDFTAALGRVLSRPTLLAVPAVVLRIALGEIAGELLGSLRVEPAELEGSGFAFRHPDLEGALRALLDGTRRP